MIRRYDYRVTRIDEERHCGRCGDIGARLAARLQNGEFIDARKMAEIGQRIKDCRTCGGDLDYVVTFARAIITRDGVDTWAIDTEWYDATGSEEAARLAELWLDTHKPGWRSEDAYRHEPL